MKVSENWLRQWVNPALSAEQMGEQLTMAGLELDDLTKVARDFSGVVVGQVLSVEPHPDADKLRVTRVDVGEHSREPLQIVCGAPNVAAGIKAPVALIGAKLPPAAGDDKPFNIKKGKLRGVESHGMLCGASEIDLPDEVDGLLILPDDAPIGMDVRAYLDLDNHVLDIAITPNRGDCFSVRGIARELAALNDLPFALPFDPASPTPTDDTKPAVTVTTDACPRYWAQAVSGLDAMRPSPMWMKQALNAAGVRPRNLLVDVTNYVLLELGQPLHAFDADKIRGDIVVRLANTGETLTLLNEQTITLQGDELLIADDEGAIALAGIMGGQRTAVTDSTTRVVIESAFFDPLAIAGRARRFGLHTDASQRYERGVDFDLPKLALDRAVSLLAQFGQGVVGQATLVERATALPTRAAVHLSVKEIARLLGETITLDTAVAILQRLGLGVEVVRDGDAAQIVATPPSYRYDISLPEDLIEEIARIYGYNRIANQLPKFAANFADTSAQRWLHDLKHGLTQQGYFEAVSFSFSDAKIEALFDDTDGKTAAPLALANPISADLAVMRRTLLSSLLPCVQYNLNRQQTRVRLFETGLRFMGSDIATLAQVNSLALVAVGNVYPEQPDGNRAMDFYDLKHDVESVLPPQLLASGALGYQRSAQAFLHPGQSADILWHTDSVSTDNVNAARPVGWLGQLHPQIAKALDLPTTWVAQLDMAMLAELHQRPTTIAPLSKFPQVRRDIALVVARDITVQDILGEIRRLGGDLLHASWPFDVYTGDQLPADKRSLAFGLVWQDPAATLSDDVVNAAMQRMVDGLGERFGAVLR